MVKRHLSRLNAPKSWPMQRKGIKFVTRPSTGAHALRTSMPLSLVMTNLLKHARVRKEVKKILHEGNILVNGKVRRDYAYPVGLMDIVTVNKLNESYRVVFTTKGKFALVKLDDKEKDLQVFKIKDKTIIKKGKVQLNSEAGSSLIVEKDSYNTRDTIVRSMKDGKIVEHLVFKKGSKIYITGGNRVGTVGSLEEVKGNNIIVKMGSETFETAKRYAFVIGNLKVSEE